MEAMASDAALAAPNLQQIPPGAASLAMIDSVAAALAASDPQPPPDGAAFVALVKGGHQQAPCWAALKSLVPLGHWRS